MMHRPIQFWNVLVLGAGVFLAGGQVFGAAAVRVFPMDMGLAVDPADPFGPLVEPAVGLGAAFIFNANSDDAALDLQSPIGAEPIFVVGRTGLPGDLAVSFDGSLQNPGAEPGEDNQATTLFGRSFCTTCPDEDVNEILLAVSGGQFGSSFSLGHQLWAKPDIAGLGSKQVLSINGDGQWGGIGITQGGNWAHIWSRNGDVQFDDSGVAVDYDAWTNVAAITTGGVNRLFVNGSAASLKLGCYWQGGVSLTLAAGANGFDDAYMGNLDDVKMMVASAVVGGFSPQLDLDFYEDQVFSGIVGDVDQDGEVGVVDYEVWAMNVGFNNRLGFGDPASLLRGDTNQNGVIDLGDLEIIKGAATGSGMAIPEPGSLVVLGMGALGLVRRRGL